MSGSATTVSEKQLAADALGRMPESATLRQISEELALLARFARRRPTPTPDG